MAKQVKRKLFEKKPSVVPVRAEWPEGEFDAFTILRRPGSGGLYTLRRLTISNGVVIKSEDEVEDLFGIKQARLNDALEFMPQPGEKQ